MILTVVCQLPPDAGVLHGTMAKLVRPAYGLDDTPPRWWNKIDQPLRTYGAVLTRLIDARRFYTAMKQNGRCFQAKRFSQPTSLTTESAGEGIQPNASLLRQDVNLMNMTEEESETMLEYLLDPITGSPARKMKSME